MLFACLGSMIEISGQTYERKIPYYISIQERINLYGKYEMGKDGLYHYLEYEHDMMCSPDDYEKLSKGNEHFYSYDKKNRLVKDIRTHEPYSELLSQSEYKYDKKNRTIVAEMMGIADSMVERTVYYFDKNDRLKKLSVLDERDTLLATTTYEYNDAGFRSLATFTEGENGIYKGTEKFRFDTDGFLAERCSYYLTELRQAFLYTYYYDEEGNWVKAYVYHVTPTEGYLYQVITRQISYFD